MLASAVRSTAKPLAQRISLLATAGARRGGSNFLAAAAGRSLPAARPAPTPRRGYASGGAGGGKQQAAESNLPLYLSLGGVAGLGLWYSLGGFGDLPPKAHADAPAGDAAAVALNKDEFRTFTLKEKKPYNHDSSFFVFELPDGQKPGMNVASAVVVRSADDSLKDKNGKSVVRPYTPTSTPDTAGHIDFLIKRYPDGLMTNHMFGLKPGDKLAIKGPIPKWPYKANEFDNIALVGGGSGVTPLLQLCQAIEANAADKTQVTLLYSNKTDDDILLKEYFDTLAKKDKRFKIVYGVDQKGVSTPADVFEGHMNAGIIKRYLPGPGAGDKLKIFICGPPGQVKALAGAKAAGGKQPEELSGVLKELGYTNDQVYRF